MEFYGAYAGLVKAVIFVYRGEGDCTIFQVVEFVRAGHRGEEFIFSIRCSGYKVRIETDGTSWGVGDIVRVPYVLW